MSWGKHRRGKRGYHHGNLREALVDAALGLISERGAEAVTLAEVARIAGVSTAAPYRHFTDRDALMAEVAKRGFARFADTINAAIPDDDADPLHALQAAGRAYLQFARKEPTLYAAMFEAGIAPSSDNALSLEAERAFTSLQGICERLHKTLPEERRAPPLMMALHIWALSHGIASLFARGTSARRAIPVPAEDLLEAGVLIYLHGLGFEQE